MTNDEKTFTEVNSDSDLDAARDKFLYLASSLINQGANPKSVFRGLYWAGVGGSLDHALDTHMDFILTAKDHAPGHWDSIAAKLDDCLDETLPT